MAPPGEMELRCLDGPPELAGLLGEILARGAADLGLATNFGGVIISPDDIRADGEAWFHFAPGPAGDPRPHLILYCHPDSFCRPLPRTRTLLPEREVWEQTWSPEGEAAFRATEFSAERSSRFLHHNFLTAQDMARGTLPAAGSVGHHLESFSAAWAVTVDGRLDRAGLAGYPLTERRGHFSRLFSTAGVLLPDHWQIFQSLWDGGLSGWREVLAVTDRLPRIRSKSGA